MDGFLWSQRKPKMSLACPESEEFFTKGIDGHPSTLGCPVNWLQWDYLHLECWCYSPCGHIWKWGKNGKKTKIATWTRKMMINPINPWIFILSPDSSDKANGRLGNSHASDLCHQVVQDLSLSKHEKYPILWPLCSSNRENKSIFQTHRISWYTLWQLHI